MDCALDYPAKSTDPLAQLWRVRRRKRYGGIPVRRIEAVWIYDHAFDGFTLRTSGVVLVIFVERPIFISAVELHLWLSKPFRLCDERDSKELEAQIAR